MKTAIVILLDASGSMAELKSDVVGSFNTFLENQKKTGDLNDIVKFYSFSTKLTSVTNWEKLSESSSLSEDKYNPSGGTALIDSMCDCVIEAGKYFKESSDKPEKVLFLTITDGEENSSSRFKIEDLKSKIQHQTEKYDWCFSFIGANVDSFSIGNSYGLNKSSIANYENTSKGYSDMALNVSSAVTLYRTSSTKVLDLNG